MRHKWKIGIGISVALLICAVSISSKEAPARIVNSPQWKDGEFVNAEPMKNDFWGGLKSLFEGNDDNAPRQPLPTIQVKRSLFDVNPKSGLRMTWLGHSSVILEIDGTRLLVDPNWAERSSPVSFAGAKRWYAPLIALDSLPTIHAVLFSHNHYDHFDPDVVRSLAKRNLLYIVPLGLGESLLSLGIPKDRIVELDWWESTKVQNLTITSTPARHASGRGLFDQGKSLWTGFTFQSNEHKVYYSGDTGPFKAAKEIGDKLGPFDLSIIECGQYNKAWPDWHLFPELTLGIHRSVRGKILVPVHWGLFTLATHSWKEPVQRLLAANKNQQSSIIVPRPGESFEPEKKANEPMDLWWERVQ